MNNGCAKRDDCWMNIGSPDFVREQRFEGCLVTAKHGSSDWSDAKKNGMRHLSLDRSRFLRSSDTTDSGSVVWRGQSIPGDRIAESFLPQVRCGEAGAPVMVGQQSVLHEAICVSCWETVSCVDDSGCGQGIEARLEDGQGFG